MNQNQQPVPPPELDETVELITRLDQAKDPDPQDVNRLRQLVVNLPKEERQRVQTFSAN